MADYWVSNNRYFCKYCKIYIADEINQRRQHEEGLKHKGNVDRYIKDLYKRGAQQKKDKEDEAREIKRIEQAAHAAMGAPSSASVLSRATGEPSSSKTARTFAPSLDHYSNAASLGLAPDQEEPIVIMPGQRRTDQGEAGEWHAVEPSAPSASTSHVPIGPAPRQQRPHEDEEAPTHRSLREKTAVFDDELYDPGEIKTRWKPGEARVKKEETMETEVAPRATFRPIRFGQPIKTEEEPPNEATAERSDLLATPQEEVKPTLVALSEEKPPLPKTEAAEPPLFKKRKRKGMTNGS